MARYTLYMTTQNQTALKQFAEFHGMSNGEAVALLLHQNEALPLKEQGLRFPTHQQQLAEAHQLTEQLEQENLQLREQLQLQSKDSPHAQ